MDDQTFTYDQNEKLTKNEYSIAGYKFNGWNTSKDGKGTSYSDEADILNMSSTNNSNIKLYAQWLPNEYTVKYDNNSTYNKDVNGNELLSNEFSNNVEPSIHTFNVAKNLNNNEFTLTGYHFMGWNTKEDGTGTPFTNKQSVINLTTEDKGEVTVFAMWEIDKYKVEFMDLDYTVLDTQQIEYKSSATAIDDPIKDDLEFAGWEIVGGDNTLYTKEDLDKMPILSNTQFHAVYKNIELINIDFSKVWNDEDDLYQVRPNSIFIQLYKDGVASGNPIEYFGKDGKWEFVITSLPETYHNKKIEYTISEIKVNGYDEAIIEQTNEREFIVTNNLNEEFSKQKVTYDVVLNKLIEGTKPGTITKFDFEMIGIDNEKLVDGKAIGSIEGEGSLDLISIEFDTTEINKKYVFNISEIKGNVKGYTYDDRVFEIIIEIKTEKGTGKLLAEAFIDEIKEGNITFINHFRHIPNSMIVNKDPGRTCQDDGYPVGYYWDDAKQACVINKYSVPKTATNNQMILFVIMLMLSGASLVYINTLKRRDKRINKE